MPERPCGRRLSLPQDRFLARFQQRVNPALETIRVLEG